MTAAAPTTSPVVSFDEFVASGRRVADLAEFVDGDLDDVPGFVYEAEAYSGLHIVDQGDGEFSLPISNHEYLSHDITLLEGRLYEFALGEAISAPEWPDAQLMRLRTVCKQAGIGLVQLDDLRFGPYWVWARTSAERSTTRAGSEREAAIDALEACYGAAWKAQIAPGDAAPRFLDWVEGEIRSPSAQVAAEHENDEGGMRP